MSSFHRFAARSILAAGLAFGVGFGSTVASAQDAANADDCLKAAFDLAQKAEEKKLSNTDLDQIEDLLTKMEGHCDAKQFAEASTMSKEITVLIDSKR